MRTDLWSPITSTMSIPAVISIFVYVPREHGKEALEVHIRFEVIQLGALRQTIGNGACFSFFDRVEQHQDSAVKPAMILTVSGTVYSVTNIDRSKSFVKAYIYVYINFIFFIFSSRCQAPTFGYG